MGTARQNATKAQARGAQLEAELEHWHTIWRRQGKADMRRIKAPVNIIGSLGRGQFRAVLNGEAHVDFEGVLRGGLSVCFDAKHVERGASFALSQLRDNQLVYLSQRARFGAVAFVFVRRHSSPGQPQRDYVLPVDGSGRIAGLAHERMGLARGQETPVKSVRFEDLEAAGLCGPWVDVVEAAIEAGRWPGVIAGRS